MQTHLHQELESLKVTIMKMFTIAERAFQDSVTALMQRDDDLANQVMQGDKSINRLEVEIEEKILNILALWQPVARDLRFVTGCSRIASDLERIGDQSTNIAERAILLNQKPKLSFMNGLQSLSDVAAEMFRNVITAFSQQDCTMAVDVCNMDNRADELNVQIMRQLIDYMSTESKIVERAVHTLIVANALERVGDLATNIAEDVVFIVMGVNVRHSNKFDSSCNEGQGSQE
jgi:phosphate transport system protein